MWIEIFKTGRHVDSSGKEKDFSADELDRIANSYNESLSKDESFIAPVVKGHPKNNDPAFGWVGKLKRSGEFLLAKLKDLTPEFANELKNKRYRKVSVSLYPDLMLRHLGFLGAMQPSVKGLKPVNFSENDFTEFEYEGKNSEANGSEPEIETKEGDYEVLLMKFNEQSDELDKAKGKIKELSYNAFLNEEKAFCEKLVKEGKMLPKEADMNADMLVNLRELDENFRFSEGHKDNTSLYAKHRDMLAAREIIVELDSQITKQDNQDREFNFSESDLNNLETRQALHEKACEISERGRRNYSDVLRELIA